MLGGEPNNFIRRVSEAKLSGREEGVIPGWQPTALRWNPPSGGGTARTLSPILRRLASIPITTKNIHELSDAYIFLDTVKLE